MAIYLPGGLLSVKDKFGYGKKTVSFFDQNAGDE
jgi:hypothetical protein